MDKQQIQQLLMEVLIQTPLDGGHPLVDMSVDTCPLDEIRGFDSLTAIEVTVELARRLEREIPVENIFVNGDGQRFLNVREITERLHERLNAEVDNHDRRSS